MTDPGFPSWGGGRQPLGLRQKPIIWQDLCQKDRTKRGWHMSLAPYQWLLT